MPSLRYFGFIMTAVGTLSLVVALGASCSDSAPRVTLEHVGDIVSAPDDPGGRVFTTDVVPRDRIVGAIYVRWPNRPRTDGAYLVVQVEGETITDDAALEPWRALMRARAAVVRTNGDNDLAKKLETCAAMPAGSEP